MIHHKIVQRIMTSWVPPMVAFAFVVSFELGRRKRQRENMELKINRGTSKNEVIKDVGGAAHGKTKLKDKSEPPTPEVIQVSDHVLGYGGHGTVVYKGNLEGRQVAVKKMLKAYHASADREISLLISSDGHENVVRYFLKEIRGDFVYLALELCDMSLHDLVLSLCKYQAARNSGMIDSICLGFDSGSVSKGIKSALRQISNGIMHIHSLRIVHRDLKPQNILMARKRTPRKDDSVDDIDSSRNFISVLRLLEQGEYIPKVNNFNFYFNASKVI